MLNVRCKNNVWLSLSSWVSEEHWMLVSWTGFHYAWLIQNNYKSSIEIKRVTYLHFFHFWSQVLTSTLRIIWILLEFLPLLENGMRQMEQNFTLSPVTLWQQSNSFLFLLKTDWSSRTKWALMKIHALYPQNIWPLFFRASLISFPYLFMVLSDPPQYVYQVQKRQ